MGLDNLLYKISRFFNGRYGNDQLNKCLLVLWLILLILNIFLNRTVLSVASLCVIGLYLFRALSRNTNKRYNENIKFLPYFQKSQSFIKLQYKKLKDFRTYRYKKCASCKSQLRLPKRKGKHTARCPKCKCEFDVRFWL